MVTVKLWGRIQPKQASQKFYRCGIEFSREWPEEPIEVDKATAERLKQEQMLEVTYTDPYASLNKTEPEGFERTAPADQASDTSVTDASDALDNHDALNANADLPQGAVINDGGNVTGIDGDKSAAENANTAPLDGFARHDAIKAAIGQLDPANTDVWTVSGSPKADALSEITGWSVSAADRDAVWVLVLAEQGNP